MGPDFRLFDRIEERLDLFTVEAAQEDGGQNRDEDRVHRAKKRGNSAGEAVDAKHLQAEAEEIARKADSKDRTHMLFFEGLEHAAQL